MASKSVVELVVLGGTLKVAVRDVDDRAGAYFSIQISGVTVKGKHMAYTLPNDKVVDVGVSYVDAHGNPATVDGPVTWSSSNDAIATVDAKAGDDKVATITPVGPVGNVQISVTADADLGEGTRELITLFDVSVVGGEAVAGTIAPVEVQPR
jgi:hypothetical protein